MVAEAEQLMSQNSRIHGGGRVLLEVGNGRAVGVAEEGEAAGTICRRPYCTAADVSVEI
jgi:hypothetical protein